VLSRGDIQLSYAELSRSQPGSADEGHARRPPLLLLHGLAARWQVFGPLIPAFADRWHLYAPDLRGHGCSAWAAPRYHLNDFVDDILALLDERINEPALIYGHSLGGWLALTIAARRPDAVQAVVVGDTALYPAGIDPDFAVSYLVRMPIAMRSLAKSLNQMDPDVMVHFRSGGVGLAFDADAELPRISCPVLLLQGDPAMGALMSDTDVARALPLLADGAHVRFDGLGHGLHVEDAGSERTRRLPKRGRNPVSGPGGANSGCSRRQSRNRDR